MGKLLHYRLWCVTDNKYEYIWKDEAEASPTTCPVNTAHTIDTDKTGIVDERSDNEVHVQEEATKTGGHYQAQSFELDMSATEQWNEKDITFPIPVNILSASWVNLSEYKGDSAQFLIAPDTIIGTITEDIAVDDDEISVAASVIANIKKGYWVTVDSEDLGRVKSIDVNGSKITVETAAASTHSSGAYVKITAKMVPHIKMVGGNSITELGQSKIGASYIPEGKVLKLRYYNADAQAKEFSFLLEYLY